MARPSTAAALLLLALSLLAVAHCRPIEAEPAESNAVVVAISDENGAAENPGLPAEAGASDTKVTVVPPVEEQEQQQQGQGGFLRLPSQGHGRPCRHGLRHRWARHHGVLGDAPRRFRSRHGEERLAAVLPAEAEEEVKAVAAPDPDRSLPGTVRSFGDADGARDAGDEGAAAVRAWKKEMLRRWVHLHAQSHHGMRHHRLHQGEQAAEDQVAVAGEGLKRFHHRRHHDDDEEDEEKEKEKRKRFRPAEHHDDDSDDDEEVEEMVRRFRKAVARRTRLGHGRRFHHHRHDHHHGEEAEKPEAGEESGVVTWIKGLMNRF